jgi:uncharacterized protein
VSQLTQTARTTFGRHRERGGHDRELLHAILDAGTICHFGIVMDGAPMVVPTVYGRDGDTVYLHGSVASRSLMAAGGGIDICMTVSLVDGLVLARSVFEHSVNYRSAMVYGRSRLVSDAAEKLIALRAVTDHVCPGQWDYARRPSKKELAATTVIALPLLEASSKVRDSGPGDSDGPDRDLPIWAGVLPIRTLFGTPIDDPAAARPIDTPAHVSGLVGLATEDRRAPLQR